MRNIDLSAFSAAVVTAVKSYVAKSEDALAKRIVELEAQLKALPVPQKGDKGDSIKGDPGKDADPEVMRAMIVAEVARAVAALPPAKQGDPGAPGKDIDPADVNSAIDAAVALRVAALPSAKQGEPGKDGASVHPDTIALMVRDAADKVVAAMPKPKDGRDGFSLDDFDATLSEDGRTLTLKFARGALVKERQLELPTLNYRDIWREGEYRRGDVVTWGGSAWHCQNKTTEKPGNGCVDWKLMVKEGRAGKDAVTDAPRAQGVVRFK